MTSHVRWSFLFSICKVNMIKRGAYGFQVDRGWILPHYDMSIWLGHELHFPDCFSLHGSKFEGKREKEWYTRRRRSYYSSKIISLRDSDEQTGHSQSIPGVFNVLCFMSRSFSHVQALCYIVVTSGTTGWVPGCRSMQVELLSGKSCT